MDNELENLRREIDALDGKIVALLCGRMEASGKIGEYKRRNSLPVYVPEREKSLLENVAVMAGEKYAPYICAVYESLLRQSGKYQEDNFNG